jgi:hypothetical protein
VGNIKLGGKMKNTGNLFELARRQLEKKHRKFTPLNVFDSAVKIRQRLDKQEEKREKNLFKKSV